jgi:fibronectin-binding autotransporter adhesin
MVKLKTNQKMKTTFLSKLAILLTLTVVCATISDASVSVVTNYVDDFSGLSTANLSGTVPDTTLTNANYPSGALWQSGSTTFKANGSVASAPGTGSGVWLPFTPVVGHIYNISANMNTTGGGQNWITLSFSIAATAQNYRVVTTSVGSMGTLILRANRGSGTGATDAQFYHGLFGSSGTVTMSDATPPAGVVAVGVTLDCTDPNSANWTTALSFNGSTVFAAAPSENTNYNNIKWIGFTDSAAVGTIGNLVVTDTFTNEPTITLPPSDVTVVQGNPAAFSVTAVGAPPLAYQWRSNNVAILNATNASYSIAATQPADAGAYDVIVTNSYGAVTSTPPATLMFYVPQNLTWLGSASFFWNTNDVNWDTNADNVADTTFTQGDNVTFNDNGLGQPIVDINSVLTPNSMTVNSSGTYTFFGFSGGLISGYSRLVKDGSGTLTLTANLPFIGATTIKNGILQVGNGDATPWALPSGSITNNGTLLFNSTAVAFNLAGPLTGSGALTNLLTANITISGTNTMSGPVYVAAGQLTLSGVAAKGNAPSYTLNATPVATVGTRLNLGGGITFDPSTTFAFLNTSASPDSRCSLISTSGTNTVTGAITLTGDGTVGFYSSGPASNSLLQVTSPTINSPGFTGKLLLRGIGNGLLTSSLNTPLQVLSKTDSGTWTVTSAGNAWTNTDVGAGALRMGAAGVLPANATLTMENGTLDLAGFNQTIGMLVANTNTSTANGVIGSSSTSADATLTVNTTASTFIVSTSTVTNFFNIRDSLAGGTRKVGLTLANGTLIFTGVNTYSGDTTVNAGILDLGASAVSTNSTYKIASGAVLNLDYAATVTNRIPGLVLNGVTQTNGVYNSANGSPYLTGTGNLIVGSAGPSLIPPQLTNSVSGGVLTLSWAADHLGYSLQMQTNDLNVGLSTNWVTVPGSEAVTTTNLPISPSSPEVFYRLQYVP